MIISIVMSACASFVSNQQCIMATKIITNEMFLQHGWWIAVEDINKPVLCITNHPMIEGHYTTTLAKRYEEIVTVKIHPSWQIYIICRREPGQVPVQL